MHTLTRTQMHILHTYINVVCGITIQKVVKSVECRVRKLTISKLSPANKSPSIWKRMKM